MNDESDLTGTTPRRRPKPDVLEIGDEGVRWVSGVLAAAPETQAAVPEMIELSADFAVPALLAATGLGAVVPMFDAVLQQTSPHIVHAQSDAYGAAVVTVDTDALAVEFLVVTGVRDPQYAGIAARAGFRVAAGSSRITTT